MWVRDVYFIRCNGPMPIVVVLILLDVSSKLMTGFCHLNFFVLLLFYTENKFFLLIFVLSAL